MKWEVHTKGGPGRPYEICVIRANFDHGKRSYGWFGKEKVHISSSGGPCNDKVSRSIWDKLIVVANEICRELNESDKG